MSPTIGLPPPSAERCLETSRKSKYWGGTLIAEAVGNLDEHRRCMANPDRYRRTPCERCGSSRLHVHSRPERHPRGELSLPPVVTILQFRCAECSATWRMLPSFLARHLWHPWEAVERAVVEPPLTRASNTPPIAPRTERRWLSRLLSSARLLVALLAASGGATLEAVAMSVGLDGTRAELVVAFATMTSPEPGAQLASLGALVHRLERGLRLM